MNSPTTSTLHQSADGRQNMYPTPITLHSSSTHSPYFSVSPQSTPSPSTMTPTEEYPHTQVVVAGHRSDVSHDYDLTSMFLTYPGLMGCEEAPYGQLIKDGQASDFMKQPHGHCGCLHEPSSYNVVLELSLRLRKAADILSRSASHHVGSHCFLNQRISDLDAFAT